MIFSFTGLNYLFGFCMIAVLTYRFFVCWQKEKTKVSQTFFYFAAALDLFFLATAIGSLFFANSTSALKLTVFVVVFFQGLAAAFMSRLLFYIKFPNISSWFGFLIVFGLGMAALIISVILPFTPHLESTKSINWDIHPLAGIFRYLVFLVGELPMCIIFLRQPAQNPALRLRSFGLGLMLLITLLIVPFDFFLNYLLKLEAIGSDLAVLFTWTTLFFVLILTQKSPPPPYVKKVYE